MHYEGIPCPTRYWPPDPWVTASLWCQNPQATLRSMLCLVLLPCCLVANSCLTLCDPMDGSRPSFPVLHYLTVCSNSRPLSRWNSHHLITCRPLLLLPSIFPSIRVSSNESALASSGQSIGASALGLTMNIQSWYPLRLTALISLQSKGLSRVFFNITTQKHQLFDAKHYLLSSSHICTWLLKKL